MSKRRRALLILALITVALGLSIRAFSDGAWADPVGDGLYAVLVYLAIAFLVPRKSKAVIAVVALVTCVAVELFQLTGIPTELRLVWAPLALIFGTTFGAIDLIAYAGGIALAFVIDSIGRRLTPDATEGFARRVQ